MNAAVSLDDESSKREHVCIRSNPEDLELTEEFAQIPDEQPTVIEPDSSTRVRSDSPDQFTSLRPRDSIIDVPTDTIDLTDKSSTGRCERFVDLLIKCVKLLYATCKWILEHLHVILPLANIIILLLIFTHVIDKKYIMVTVATGVSYFSYRFFVRICEFCTAPADPPVSAQDHQMRHFLDDLALRAYLHRQGPVTLTDVFGNEYRPRRRRRVAIDRPDPRPDQATNYGSGRRMISQFIRSGGGEVIASGDVPRRIPRMMIEATRNTRNRASIDDEHFVIFLVEILNRRLEHINRMTNDMITAYEFANNLQQENPTNGLPTHVIDGLPTEPFVASADGEVACCSICLENLVEAVMMTNLPCNHKFHTECVKKWLVIQNACPNCKSQVSS